MSCTTVAQPASTHREPSANTEHALRGHCIWGGWCHVDLLIKFTVEVGSLHIELFDFPVLHSSSAQQKANCFQLSDRGIGLIMIQTIDLQEAMSNKLGFVTCWTAISIAFGLIDPLAADSSLALRENLWYPCTHLL